MRRVEKPSVSKWQKCVSVRAQSLSLSARHQKHCPNPTSYFDIDIDILNTRTRTNLQTIWTAPTTTHLVPGRPLHWDKWLVIQRLLSQLRRATKKESTIQLLELPLEQANALPHFAPHLSLEQSLSKAQATPLPQPRQSGPPQSMPVSSPLWMSSVQEPAVGDAVVGDNEGVCDGDIVGAIVGLIVGALVVGLVVGIKLGLSVGLVLGDAVGASAEQVLSGRQPVDRQSSFVEHVRPAEQPGQSAPPQSTSVSAPFSLASVHVPAVGETVGLVVGVDVALIVELVVRLVVGLAVDASPQATTSNVMLC